MDISPAVIDAAIQQALNTNIVPDGKTTALVVMGTTDGGATAMIATKLGERWTFSGAAAWHGGGDFSAGAQLTASW